MTSRPHILIHPISPECKRKRNVIDGFFDSHSYKPTNQFVKELLFSVANGLVFSDQVCCYFGINTFSHEEIMRKVLEDGLVSPKFLELNFGNGVAITSEIERVTGCRLEFSTTHDYMPTSDTNKNIIEPRRKYPMDENLQKRMHTVSMKISPKQSKKIGFSDNKKKLFDPYYRKSL